VFRFLAIVKRGVSIGKKQIQHLAASPMTRKAGILARMAAKTPMAEKAIMATA
jgi:hypothetical protein